MPDSSQYTRLDGEGGLINSWRNGLTMLEKVLIVTMVVSLVTIVTMAVVLARCQSHVHPSPDPITTVTPVPTNGTTLPTPKPTTKSTTPKSTTIPTTPKTTTTRKPTTTTTKPTTTSTVKPNKQNGVLTPELNHQSNESSQVTEAINKTATQTEIELIPQPTVVVTNMSTVEVKRNETVSTVELPEPIIKEAPEIKQVEIVPSNITTLEAKLANNSATKVPEDLTKTVKSKMEEKTTV